MTDNPAIALQVVEIAENVIDGIAVVLVGFQFQQGGVQALDDFPGLLQEVGQVPLADGGELIRLGHEGRQLLGRRFGRGRGGGRLGGRGGGDRRSGVLGRKIGHGRAGRGRGCRRLAALQLGGDAGDHLGGVHVALGAGLLQIFDHGPQEVGSGQDHIRNLGIDGQVALAQLIEDVLGFVGQAVDAIEAQKARRPLEGMHGPKNVV